MHENGVPANNTLNCSLWTLKNLNCVFYKCQQDRALLWYSEKKKSKKMANIQNYQVLYENQQIKKIPFLKKKIVLKIKLKFIRLGMRPVYTQTKLQMNKNKNWSWHSTKLLSFFWKHFFEAVKTNKRFQLNEKIVYPAKC